MTKGTTSRLSRFFAEVKRRKVYHVAAAYLAVGVAISLAVPDLFAAFELPTAAARLVIVVIAIGFPVALMLAWAYEVRPEEPGTVGSVVGSVPAPASTRRLQVSPDDVGRSIVVLPFDNLSPDDSDAYLAGGVTEEITADLSGLRALRVISRTSAQGYRGSGKDVRTIGHELSVRYVLEGSVRKVGDDLRITCQLIDAAGDAHVWAEKYSGTMEDIFDVQERVARSVVEALAIELDAGEERSLAGRPIKDLAAYQLYLRARADVLSFDRERMERAERHLGRALEIVGENGALLFQLAHLHYQVWNLGVRLNEEDLTLAREYADRALVLDPRSPDHMVIRGLLEVTGGNAVRGYAYLEAALDRDPRHPEALFWSPAISGFLGRAAEANARLAELERIDPLNPLISTLPVWFEIKAGRFGSALELALGAREETSPVPPLLEAAYATALALNGRPTEAAEILRACFTSRSDMLDRAFRARGLALEGDRAGVLRLLDPEYGRWAEKDFQYSEFTAETLAQVGEINGALDWLEISVSRGNVNYPYLSAFDPFLKPLRGHERFRELMARLEGEWEAFGAAPVSGG